MPRYFFHLFEDGDLNLVRDSEGAPFASSREAKNEAIALARDIAEHRLYQPTWQIVVTDENADIVSRVSLSEIHPSIAQFLLKLARRIAIYEPRFQPYLFTWLLVATVMSMIGQGAVLNSMSRHRANISERLDVAPKATIVEVRFAPAKTMAEISQFLEAYKASLVDGPLPSGSYRLRISDGILPPEVTADIVNRMMQDKIVAFAAGQ
jgi:uncharacterized protein DUF6894